MKTFEDYGVKDWHEVTKEGKHIMFWHADWCPDCKFIEPKLPELEQEYSDFNWISFNRDDNMEIAQELGLWAFLALLLLKMVKKLVDW
jgi:Thioredoxin domain-containing protein